MPADDRDQEAFEAVGFQAHRTFHWMGQTSNEIVEETLDGTTDPAEDEPDAE